jgi:hypothetical protein
LVFVEFVAEFVVEFVVEIVVVEFAVLEVLLALYTLVCCCWLVLFTWLLVLFTGLL